MRNAIKHPSHYTSHPSGIECIQITKGLPFELGNAIKYLWRTDMKNGLEDLEKALQYLQWCDEETYENIPNKSRDLNREVLGYDTALDSVIYILGAKSLVDFRHLVSNARFEVSRLFNESV